ncbi:Unknown protein sequence [Pseudomonas syringae pv. cerasicola]|uniref:Uncharacterized protein n=2 Tax=Pseudomonas syringae group TaxID=136849 RepID=A0A0N8R3G5_PSESX|nr:Unknown protein sequence [Pseudomonas syringae pv. cerasicola]RMS76166.1 hypothetical protein ALP60_00984 [Pseudomonas savastanoi]SOS15819.1 hypothetical protein CFBP6109_01447 [Pseudomonas syringae pv. cerasicola]SPF16266.1 hypothetical protein PSCFBP6110_03789 [Pseudomonas syringae pv. cerasicola]
MALILASTFFRLWFYVRNLWLDGRVVAVCALVSGRMLARWLFFLTLRFHGHEYLDICFRKWSDRVSKGSHMDRSIQLLSGAEGG